MEKIRLGKTELYVSRTAFGALPIQRVDFDTAKSILRRAYEAGINYFDTAYVYSDSEDKIGYALSDVRENIVISTKVWATDYEGARSQLEESLRRMKTDYVDLIQFHNPAQLPDPEDKNGAYYAMAEAKRKGYVRHIGITNHRLEVARQAIASGNFETLQFPYSYLSTDDELDLAERCKAADMGFIAMKALCGGLLTNSKAVRAFFARHENVVPIYGIQSLEEMEHWIALENSVPEYDGEIDDAIEKDRKELGGEFCRGCGYCMPCPVGIEINTAARMNMLLRRSPYQQYMTKEFYAKMHKIDECLKCGKCKSKCPYGLDTPSVLEYMLKDFDEFYAEHTQRA
ncbi:MAG: aldo/keto reductase [Oscillospiraceae bacterium]|nr:aldo/keto reductase [Oscillospiraceae bacterium]